MDVFEQVWPFVFAALATSYAVQAWRQASLFADWRARTEMWTGKLGDLLACAFCATPWVFAAFVLVLGVPTPGHQAGATLCGMISCTVPAVFLSAMVAAATGIWRDHLLFIRWLFGIGAVVIAPMYVLLLCNDPAQPIEVLRVLLVVAKFAIEVLAGARVAYYFYERSTPLG